jgi:hypothetical protein
MPNSVLEGVVVDGATQNSQLGAANVHDGLYLQTDDGRLIELIRHAMPTQMPIDVMWRQSRRSFEPLLGQRATIEGYLSRRTLYSARVVSPLASAPEGD